MGRLIKLLIFMGLAAMVSPQRLSEIIPDDFERAYDCNPEPDCSTATGGEYVADPMSCNSFYICQGPNLPTDVALPCGDQIFDDAAVAPDIPCKDDDGLCTPECGGTCLVACNNTYDLVADFGNCNAYYICVPSGTIEMACPADKPYFDGADCTATKAACCKPVCELDVVCKGHAQEQIPDPTNCHGGIICVNETFPYQYSCPGGCAFDSANNKCDDSSPCGKECTDVCSDSTATGGSTAAGVTTPAGGDTTPAGGTTGGVTTPAGGTTGAGGSTTGAGGGTTGGVTTTAAGTTSACQDSLDCSTANGEEFIARCTTCDPSYFSCKSPSGSATIGECSGSLVFNPDPLYPHCIRPENCPFHPGK